MISIIMKAASTFFFKTKLGIITMIAGALLLYHFSEVKSAVRDAISNAADEALIESQKTTIALLNAKIEVNEKLIEEFESSKRKSEELAELAKTELKDYEQNNPINNKCAVDEPILNRLSNK